MNAAANKPAAPSIAGAEWLSRPSTRRVFQALAAGGHEARAVGGCVRDTLLAFLDAHPAAPGDGRLHDNADIDIATTSTPEETVRLAQAAGLRAIPTGLAHGTITVIADATPYEVTTLRHDVETYGRHADVAFTDDWALDAARRDFTINALYANPDGSIFDPLNALPDLEARRVRFVGDPHQRIREDYLRILRFFRFFARFGNGQPEPENLQACVSERAGLAHLSRERIGHEITRLLVAPHAPETIAIMAENGILTEVLPVAPMPRRLARYAALEDALAHFPVNPAMRLAALAIAIEEDAERLGEALRLSNEEIRTLALWARTIRAWKSAPPIANEKDEETQLKRRLYRLGKRDYPRDLLIRASLSPHAPAIETLRRQIDLVARWPIPVFPLSGRDLLALGLPPGPGMGELLATLETEWLASNFTLSEDWLRTRARELSRHGK